MRLLFVRWFEQMITWILVYLNSKHNSWIVHLQWLRCKCHMMIKYLTNFVEWCKSLHNHRQQAFILCLIQLFLTIGIHFFFFSQNWQLQSTWIQCSRQENKQKTTINKPVGCPFLMWECVLYRWGIMYENVSWKNRGIDELYKNGPHHDKLLIQLNECSEPNLIQTSVRQNF